MSFISSFIHRLILFLLKYSFTIVKPTYARLFVKCLSFLLGSVDSSWLYTDNRLGSTWLGKNIKTDKEDGIIKSDIVILWVPGGGFRVNLGKLYYKTFVHWLKQMETHNIKCTIIVANYRLSPEYKYPAATEDIIKIHDWLLNSLNIPKDHIIWGADDAGVAIVLDTLCKKLNQLHKPAGLLLSSPYIGMDPGGKSWRDNYGIDILTEKSVEMMDQVYSHQKKSIIDDSDDEMGDDDNDEKENQPFTYLDNNGKDFYKYIPPKVLIEVGKEEVLLDDTELLAKQLRESTPSSSEKKGDPPSLIHVELTQQQNQKHLWTLLGPKFVTNINQWERTLDLWTHFVELATFNSKSSKSSI
ncbi:unnamed protein product [Cunninghamella blakesleeana]